MNNKVYILLAEGFETVEALSIADACKRCKVEYRLISTTDNIHVTSSHGVEVIAHQLMKDTDFNDGNVLVLPGGYPGYINLSESAEVGTLVKRYYNSNKYVAAICGAPYVLKVNGIAKDRHITYHHSIKDEMSDYQYTGEKATIDGNLITGRGAGCSFDFAIVIMKQITNDEAVQHLIKGLEL
jgi:4-methyl-5(b-hydroxyethyl)-thiazole monophosphate biosynthesis